MVRKVQPFLWLLLLMLAMAGAAFAQDTGSISGVVRGADGAPLPGVTVTASGPLLPAGRIGVTDEQGAFSILRLPPGDYEVTAELTGMGSVKRPAVVALDRDTQVNLDIKPSIAEEITVTAALPTIDVKSSDVQVNYTNEQIEDLPVARTYKGLFQLAPGVSENGRLTPNAGAARMDNTYLIDGINVTNPHYGDILPNVTELDISEVSIKRGGISAEYGRSAGMVVNAITKSGTNEFRGQFRARVPAGELRHRQQDLDAAEHAGARSAGRRARRAHRARPLLVLRLGEPAPRRTSSTARNNLGAVPDREEETDEYFGKITANPASSHFLAASVRSRDTTTKNAGITANVHPTRGHRRLDRLPARHLHWVWNLTANSLAELKLNHNKEENSGIPITNWAIARRSTPPVRI